MVIEKQGLLGLAAAVLLLAGCQSASSGPWLMQNGQPWLTPDGQCVALRELRPDEKKGFCYEVMTNSYQQEHHYEPLANDEFATVYQQQTQNLEPIPADAAKVPPLELQPLEPIAAAPVSPVPHPERAATDRPFTINSAHLETHNQRALKTSLHAWREQGLQVVSVAVTGHTDSSGPLRFNNLLSYWRAQSVGWYLKKFGVSDDAIKLAGAGPSMPRPDARGPEDNRYVDLVVWLEPASQKVAVR
jgi:outer membrane protein OmpA-like peptidoglycan-associated protein